MVQREFQQGQAGIQILYYLKVKIENKNEDKARRVKGKRKTHYFVKIRKVTLTLYVDFSPSQIGLVSFSII